MGTEIVRVPLGPENWTLAPERVPEDVDLIVAGNPNNPTGTLTPAAVLREFARPDRPVVIDESFIEFVPGESESLAGDRERPGLIVVRSLTKLYGLAGIRAGYLLADPMTVSHLEQQRQPWSVNAVACRVLALAARDLRTPSVVASKVARCRDRLNAALSTRADVMAWPGVANFLLLRVSNGPALRDGLRARGIAVRPAASFPGLDDRHIRIAVRPAPDNERLLNALAEVLGEMLLVVLLGGARSGKSVLAVRLAEARSESVVMIATAEALDDEMAARIEQHRRERPDWETIETPLELESAMASVPDETTAIIDCLTVWVSNLLIAGVDTTQITARASALAEQVGRRTGLTIAVSNEVGMGIVPDNALARRYRDVLGAVNATWAATADHAHLLVAGRLLSLASADPLTEELRAHEF